jgi:hypothetical protein
MMGERPAKVNTLFRLLYIHPEARGVLRYSIGIEKIASIEKHHITVQTWRQRTDRPDAEEMAERIGRSSLKADQLAKPKNKGLVKQLNPRDQIWPNISL